jgi:hypothetical protein
MNRSIVIIFALVIFWLGILVGQVIMPKPEPCRSPRFVYVKLGKYDYHPYYITPGEIYEGDIPTKTRYYSIKIGEEF